jgi:ABC-2 type transport system ATP-binding protein
VSDTLIGRIDQTESAGTFSSPNAIEVRSVTKSYGGRRAVDDLSLHIRRGEIFALLGPNGAGKTTTVEMLEGYRRPDAGSVRVLGCDPIADGARLKPRIGVMLQDGGLYPAITPLEALRLFAHFYDSAWDAEELLRLVGLDDAARVRYRRLSGGQKQRLALALALLPRPEVVFLDEPTTGLDPQARRNTWELIARLKGEGTTVSLTTHYLDEAERLADRIAIMDEGRLVALGTPAELVQSDGPTVRLRTSKSLDPGTLESLPSARGVTPVNGVLYLLESSDVPQLLVEITTLLRDRRVPVVDLRVGSGSLEDVFLRLTGKEFPE